VRFFIVDSPLRVLLCRPPRKFPSHQFLLRAPVPISRRGFDRCRCVPASRRCVRDAWLIIGNEVLLYLFRIGRILVLLRRNAETPKSAIKIPPLRMNELSENS
jgi:hypothetical protein